MSTSDFRQDSYHHVLLGDVASAHERVQHSDSPTHRREIIRTIFSAIEGVLWKLKERFLGKAHQGNYLSLHEQSALMEQSYVVGENGSVRVQAKFLPIPSAIRLIVELTKRCRPEYEVDFNHKGWFNLKDAIKVRNRLVHPKCLQDLSIADVEIEQALSAFYWLIALAIEVPEQWGPDRAEHN